MQKFRYTNIKFLENLMSSSARKKILFSLFSLLLFFVAVLPANSAVTSQTYVERKTSVAGTGMATAGQIAKYVADGATGEMKLTGADSADVTGLVGAMTVSDILTGTDTANKLVSAQTINVVNGSYVTTTGTRAAYLASVPGFVLQNGARVTLRMNSYNDPNPTLNINGTGAKKIKYYGDAAFPGIYILADTIVEFMYDSSLDGGNGGYMLTSRPAMAPAGRNDIVNSNTAPASSYSGDAIKQGILSYAGAVMTTTGTASAYTVTDATNYVSSAANLNSGTKVVVKIHAVNAAGATLNLNAMGAKDIYFNDAAITAGLLQIGGIYTLVYDGTVWNILMSPNAGTIPLPTAECANPGNKCGLTYGSVNPDGSGGMVYTWEVVSR